MELYRAIQKKSHRMGWMAGEEMIFISEWSFHWVNKGSCVGLTACSNSNINMLLLHDTRVNPEKTQHQMLIISSWQEREDIIQCDSKYNQSK